MNIQRKQVLLEIKSGKTVATDFFNNFDYWEKTTNITENLRYLIYGGEEDQDWPKAKVLSWRSLGNLLQTIK